MPSSTPDWSALASDNERLVTVTAPGGPGSDNPGGEDRQGRADDCRASLPALRACRPGPRTRWRLASGRQRRPSSWRAAG
jgi:hypothetical protein